MRGPENLPSGCSVAACSKSPRSQESSRSRPKKVAGMGGRGRVGRWAGSRIARASRRHGCSRGVTLARCGEGGEWVRSSCGLAHTVSGLLARKSENIGHALGLCAFRAWQTAGRVCVPACSLCLRVRIEATSRQRELTWTPRGSSRTTGSFPRTRCMEATGESVLLFRCRKCGHVQCMWCPCRNGSCNLCGACLTST